MNTVKPAPAHTGQNDLESQAVVIKPLVVATGIFNVVVPLLFAIFAWQHVAAFVHTLRISNVIILAQAVLVLQFYVRKSTAPFVRTSAYAWLIALGGAVAPLMFRPTVDESDVSVAIAIQVIGAAMQIHLITTLNLGFGAAMARRGVRGDGLYRHVRHPLYLTFIISYYGYVLNHSSFYNVCVLALLIFVQVLRLNEEERLLRDDLEFQEYVERTPWRIIPKVF
jgi:protein-S-isoprenylcysteine O-methyltransferase Ste14